MFTALEAVGPGKMEPKNEAGLKSHAIASFIPHQTVYTPRVRKNPLSKVPVSSSCVQSQGQAARGRNVVFP